MKRIGVDNNWRNRVAWVWTSNFHRLPVCKPKFENILVEGEYQLQIWVHGN